MFDFLISSAHAASEGAKAAQPSMVSSLAPFAIIFIIFYFLMIRPQKKRIEQEKLLLGGLSKGDEVFTKSGMLGTIQGLTERVVTLEVSDGVKLKVMRDQIGGLAAKLFDGNKK
jgi:preprotein translocase subunit YajC